MSGNYIYGESVDGSWLHAHSFWLPSLYLAVNVNQVTLLRVRLFLMCLCLVLDPPHHRGDYFSQNFLSWHSRSETSPERGGGTTLRFAGWKGKLAHKPSLRWFIGLISHNGKEKLITVPPDIAAQQW